MTGDTIPRAMVSAAVEQVLTFVDDRAKRIKRDCGDRGVTYADAHKRLSEAIANALQS